MVAIKRFNFMMARVICPATGFRFKYFVWMVGMSTFILILLWFLAPSKWYSTRPISSFFDERLMKFTSGSWVNRVPTLLTIVLKTKQNIFSCYIMKTIIFRFWISDYILLMIWKSCIFIRNKARLAHSRKLVWMFILRCMLEYFNM